MERTSTRRDRMEETAKLRLSRDLRARLQERAQAEDRSESQIIRRALEHYLEAA